MGGMWMPTVLVVDDTAFMRSVIREILSSEGFEVAEAENGKVALEIYENIRPDVVTLDIVMPEMDGIEVLKKLKEMDPNAKVIMCTALGEEQILKRAIKMGAKGYVIKPFQPNKVVEEVKKVLEYD